MSRIDRFVKLAGVGVDADLAEHAFHAERARFVGHDRHDVLADLLVVGKACCSKRTKPIVVDISFPSLPIKEFLCIRPAWALPVLGCASVATARATQVPRGVRAGISSRRCLRGGLIERSLADLFVRNRNAKASAEFEQFFARSSFFWLWAILRPSPASPRP